MSDYDYKAFITYSHSDSKAAMHLQRALESYRVPSRLVGTQTSLGKIPSRLGVIFRDREELSAAGDLSESLKNALLRSEFLIVVCSPAARDSRWVNLEIAQFKASHSSDKILCYIVDGEPHASPDSSKNLECFPEALEYRDHKESNSLVFEPLAADLRKEGDGRRLAKLKIISGLLGVGLDQLIRRDAQRRQRRLIGVSLASFFGMVVMSVLTYVAIDARDGEQLRRAEAEDLIEFMLSDLRDRLDAVGRLDVLDAVGRKAIEYYSNVELAQHSEASLGRRARAFHLLGEVDDLKGDIQSARNSFEQAFQTTAELLDRQPNDGQRIYNHAQSVFWVGYLDWHMGNLAAAESAFRTYISLAEQLSKLDPDNPDWVAELGHSNINLGVYSIDAGDSAIAVDYFEKGLAVFQSLAVQDPDNSEWQDMLAQSHAWLADAYKISGDIQSAKRHRLTETEIYVAQLRVDPNNQVLVQSLATARSAIGVLAVDQGDISGAAEILTLGQENMDRLTALDPENTFYKILAASLSANLAEAEIYGGNADRALIILVDVRSSIEQLLTLDNDVIEWQKLINKIGILEGKALIAVGEVQAASTALVKTIDHLEQLAAANPDNQKIEQYLAYAYYTLGQAYEKDGQPLLAMSQADRVIALLSPIRNSLDMRYLTILGKAYRLSENVEQAAEISAYLDKLEFNHPLRSI